MYATQPKRFTLKERKFLLIKKLWGIDTLIILTFQEQIYMPFHLARAIMSNHIITHAKYITQYLYHLHKCENVLLSEYINTLLKLMKLDFSLIPCVQLCLQLALSITFFAIFSNTVYHTTLFSF